MKRYAGESLPANPRIGVIANDALGNFAAATPLLQGLRARWQPSEVVYFGGGRTRELQEASDLMDRSVSVLGMSGAELYQAIAPLAGTFDFVFNLEQSPLAKALGYLLAKEDGYVCGPCAGPGGRGELPFADDKRGDLWRDKGWIAEDLTARYPYLKSGFIGELFFRLAYLDGEVPPYAIPQVDPNRAVPDVLIATAASLTDKLWTSEAWIATIERLRASGKTVGLIGAPPKAQSAHWHGADAEAEYVQPGRAEDLRGAFALPEVVGALGRAKLVLTLDNGILHFAVAAGTPTFGLFRYGIHRLWAPPSPNLTVLTPKPGEVVASIEPERVWEALGI